MKFSRITHRFDWKLASIIAVLLWIPLTIVASVLIVWLNPFNSEGLGALGYIALVPFITTPMMVFMAGLITKPGSKVRATLATILIFILIVSAFFNLSF
jgi:hypothetical protein